MQRLGTFLLEQQRHDGSMLELHDLGDGRPVPGKTSVFATGEALWGMALLHEAFPELGFEEPALRTLDHLATSRDLDEGIYPRPWPDRSEEHTSELQSLMRISYAVFCLKKKKKNHTP